MRTVTSLISEGKYTDAIALASDVMPGNQAIQTALTVCQAFQDSQIQVDKKALEIAGGN